MPLDAELQPIVDLVNAVEGPPPAEAGAEALREGFAALCAAFGPGAAEVVAADVTLPGRSGGIPARVYRSSTGEADDASACLVFLHGGGWVIGSVDTHDALCRDLAAGAGIVVISVGYRLAPEHPYPAAVDDAEDAVAAVVDTAPTLGVDAARIAVGGDSAGGNLATVVAARWAARRAASESLPALRLQLLLYPVCDLTGDGRQHASRTENGDGYILTAEVMAFFGASYLGGTDADPASPDISPLVAELPDGLPPALVVTAEYDPLRDEGEAYAARLREAGVEVDAVRYDGAVHSFVQMSAFAEVSRRALRRCTEALRTALA
jgi:acetyl esterase